MDSEPSWNPGIHAVETVPVFEDSRVKGTLFFKKNPGVQPRMQLEHNSREVTIVDANSERHEDQVIASKSSNVWKAVTELSAATSLSSNSRSMAWSLEL